MSSRNASVNNVDTRAGARRAVVGVRRSTLSDMGNTAETPGRGALGDIRPLLDLAEVGLHDGILLDVFNLGKLAPVFRLIIEDNLHLGEQQEARQPSR